MSAGRADGFVGPWNQVKSLLNGKIPFKITIPQIIIFMEYSSNGISNGDSPHI